MYAKLSEVKEIITSNISKFFIYKYAKNAISDGKGFLFVITYCSF